MRFFKVAASGLLLVLMLANAKADPDPKPLSVDMMESCHKGLVAWHPRAPNIQCGALNTPQVKIFDSAGRLRFIGSALDSIEWAKSGLPNMPIPKDVLVRDTASEARVTHIATPPRGHGWVSYYGEKGCEPCVRHLGMFRAEVMPKLEPGTTLKVFDITAPGE